MSKKDLNLPTESAVKEFEMLNKLLDASFVEIKEFSKKKPDELLNLFKVKSLNRMLEPIKEILKNEATASFLDILEEEKIPSYSDATLVISQFQAAMKHFKNSYYGREHAMSMDYRWFTRENPGKPYRK
ncbi:hypothetical protein [Leptospira santarosai]|uniref:hypothetical protein n=1 Tax=Leptospira santarosai TaxID=28183 RepID=UPI00062D3E54|nr:hypothetical protein [Leptospira santarosai]AVV79326.1 Fumarate hydratase class II [Leptospira santarosai]ONF87851.1 hypothetical protein BWD13_05480 [Leptospira santarosai serovar Grippotyphosa]